MSNHPLSFKQSKDKNEKYQSDFSAFTLMSSSVPKSRCPPAKPPRRKLSYPNENTKVSTPESFQTKIEKPVAICQELRSKLLKAGIPVNGSSYNDALSKSSSSASSKGHSTSGTEGSDYGSLQGDHLILQHSSNVKVVKPANKTHSCSDDYFCCSTPKFSDNKKHSVLPEKLWPSVLSPTSIYYTPSCSPKSNLGWNGMELSFGRNNAKQKPVNLNEKLLLSQKTSSVYRRHNSDPQIALERRPSRRGFRHRSSDRRSQSFMGVGVGLGYSRTKFGERVKLSSDYILLSEEVKMLREMCDKLWDQLRQTQLKLELLQKKTTNPTVTPSFSDLLSEVYYAQRDRDKAVQERLKLAMAERQHLLLQIESLKEVIFRKNICEADSGDDFNEPEVLGLDKVLENLDVCNSPSKLEEHRERLLNKLSRAKNVRQKRLSQHLSKVIAQRDDALAQVQSLTEETERLRWTSSRRNSSEQACDGRGKALKRMEELEEELASLRLCYSLQSCQPNCSQSSEENDDICFYALEHGDKNQDESEFKTLLEREFRARVEAEEECRKLERLVNVLRKKLVGSSSVGIQV